MSYAPAYQLAEATVTMIESQIKSTIAAALAAVRTQRADSAVTTEPPQAYLRFEDDDVVGYRTPTIFTICTDFDFQLEQGPNHISALAKVYVAALVEDRSKLNLTLKTWRYQAALTQVLNGASLISGDGKVKLFTKIRKQSFSALYSTAKNNNSPDSQFRKEVVLELDVEHKENA